MSIESQADFDGLQRVGRVVAEALRVMELETQPGVTTGALDEIGAAVLKRYGARSAPQIVYGCPSANLISVNDEIVHGLPAARRLQPGDVVKLDVTAELEGYFADAATTVVLPPASFVAQRLQRCAVTAFHAGYQVARAGRAVADIGQAVERVVTLCGFDVIRPLSGHGVGRTIHEWPTVPNFCDRRQRDKLSAGLVLTIEPIISERPCQVVEAEDGWTLRTHNGCLAAHYEHTVIITKGPPLIVTVCES